MVLKTIFPGCGVRASLILFFYFLLSNPNRQMTGFGNSKDTAYRTEGADACAKFLTQLIESLQIQRPVIISPSMSGKFSLAFVMGEDPSLCHKRIRGFIPVAPGTSDNYKAEEYTKCGVSSR